MQEPGYRGVKRIVQYWRGGDNYLAANGRCQAFRTEWIKQSRIPEEIVNADAYKYFENQLRGGKFVYVTEAVVYDRSPLHLKEYVRQSKKFQGSSNELSKYFPSDLTPEYRIPFAIKFRAYVEEMVSHPVLMTLYLMLFLYARWYPDAKPITRFWETDVSTKR